MQYTCCLAYADEDEGMAQIITDLYTKACPGSLFFIPQWDLKRGRYVYDTTAKIIEERCDGKVIFLISEYFLASDVCRFAVNFARNLHPEGDKGRLVPFLLTDNYDHIPTVLRGIIGVKWHCNWVRETAWTKLPKNLYFDMSDTELQEIKSSVQEEVDSNSDRYLGDAPYDDDVGPPKEPIFSADSIECQALSFENLDDEMDIPITRTERLSAWFSKRWSSFKSLGRLRRRGSNKTSSSQSSLQS